MRSVPPPWFQSQMRSQFPRHPTPKPEIQAATVVSISDEKPVPSPPPARQPNPAKTRRFQSQMRSQFPRHHETSFLQGISRCVSISDEKPVPSPLYVVVRQQYNILC